MGKIIKVANPIYDVVFKYLLEDKRVAKLIISALIELEVVDIEFQPQEYTAEVKEKNFTVYRVDFKAKIKDKSGKEQLVLIELQKAKLATDIMRFRRYLGLQYANKDNVSGTGKDKKALPIITIYFLGYSLNSFKDVSIIKVARQYIDQTNKTVLKGKEYFIESLTHDSIIVQIQAIKKKRHRNKLEQVLSVFEQNDVHEVDVNIEKYPKEYQEIIRRLTSALADPEIREIMNIEDDILEELADKERDIANLIHEKEEIKKAIVKEKRKAEEAKQKAEEAKQKVEEVKKKAEEEKRKAEEEKRKAEEAKKKVEAEKKRAEEEKRKNKELMLKLAKKMKKYNESIDEIIKETGLSADEINKL